MPVKGFQRQFHHIPNCLTTEGHDWRNVEEARAARFHRCIDGRRMTEHAERDAGQGKIGRPSLHQIAELAIGILRIAQDLYLPEGLQEGFKMPRMGCKDSLRSPDGNE